MCVAQVCVCVYSLYSAQFHSAPGAYFMENIILNGRLVEKNTLLTSFKVFANRAKRMYYLPSKWAICTYLNSTVCDFVSKMHNSNKWNCKRLLVFCRLYPSSHVQKIGFK